LLRKKAKASPIQKTGKAAASKALPHPKIRVSFIQTNASRKNYKLVAKTKELLKHSAELVIQAEHKTLRSATLQVIALGDEEMLEMNQRMLGHDWYTDIMTFGLEQTASELTAEIYVSTDRAKENAAHYKNSVEQELARLVIHGLLHLAGYDDHDPNAKKQMRRKERFFLVKSGMQKK